MNFLASLVQVDESWPWALGDWVFTMDSYRAWAIRQQACCCSAVIAWPRRETADG